MKGCNSLTVFLGGALVGAALGVLFAPAKGEDTRARINEALRKRGIDLDHADMEDLIDDLVDKIKGKKDE